MRQRKGWASISCACSFRIPGLGLGLILGLAALPSCKGREVTEIMVGIGTDYPVPAELYRVSLRVSRSNSTDEAVLVDHLWELAASRDGGPSGAVPDGGVSLPTTIGLVSTGDPSQSIRITVTGMVGSSGSVVREARLPFYPDRILYLRLDLLRRCKDASCPTGQTCVPAANEKGWACIPIDVDPKTLPPYPPPVEPSVDARRETAPRDLPRNEAPRDLPRGEALPSDWIDVYCYNKAGQVVTLAGNVAGFYDGPLDQALMNYPSGVAVDDTGRVFVADHNNNRVRMIDKNRISTLDTLCAGCYVPDVIWSATGKLYYSDIGSYRVWSYDLIAKQPAVVAGWDMEADCRDGPKATAAFLSPMGLAVDLSGNILVADKWCHKIRRIYSDSTSGATSVATVAGTGVAGAVNGETNVATFFAPVGVAVDNQGTIYVADSGNHRIRRIRNNQVDLLAGSSAGFLDGIGNEAKFNTPAAVVSVDHALYVADSGNYRIRRIDLAPTTGAATVSTVAGNGGMTWVDGPALSASFNQPSDVAVDRKGRIFIADNRNSRIRLICPK